MLFPLIACGETGSFAYIAIFFRSHLLSVVLASVFSFLAVFAILGVLMALLPYRVFRKSSIYVRCAMLICFMVILSTSFAVPALVENLQRDPHSWIRLLPPVWFLGLCFSLRGYANSALGSLGGMAVLGSAVAMAVSAFTYALSYRRSFTRSAETMLNLPAMGGAGISRGFRFLDKAMLRSPFQRACYRFTLKTLFRSEKHALIFGGFTGLAVVIASQVLFGAVAKSSLGMNAIPSVDLLSIPLILVYFLVFGLRFAFEIPAPLRANWIFRFNVNPGTYECRALAKKVMLTFVAPLILICLAVYSYFWGLRVGGLHTAVVALSCILLVEGVLVRFRKIPFTCSVPTFKSHALVAIILYIIGLFVFADGIASFERMAFDDPFSLLCSSGFRWPYGWRWTIGERICWRSTGG